VCRSVKMSDIKNKMLSSSFIWKNVFHSSIIAFVFSATVNSQDYGYAIQDECSSSGLSCIPLRQCPQVNDIALSIQELNSQENNSIKKLELLNEINSRLCGGRIKKELHVCCENVVEIENLEDIPSSVAENNDKGEKFLGSFNKLTYHPVHGDLFMRDAKTLIIRNFVYDGEGPDAFFVVGKRPMRRNRIVIRDRRDAIPLPYEDSYSAYSRQNTNQRRLRYDDPDIPVLGRYEGQDIELTLPQGIEVDNIKWISLYCRQFNMDFGHVKIDNNPWGRPRTT